MRRETAEWRRRADKKWIIWNVSVYTLGSFWSKSGRRNDLNTPDFHYHCTLRWFSTKLVILPGFPLFTTGTHHCSRYWTAEKKHLTLETRRRQVFFLLRKHKVLQTPSTKPVNHTADTCRDVGRQHAAVAGGPLRKRQQKKKEARCGRRRFRLPFHKSTTIMLSQARAKHSSTEKWSVGSFVRPAHLHAEATAALWTKTSVFI